MRCGVPSLLLRGKSGPLWSAPLVYLLTQWLGAAAGAGCARVLRFVSLRKLLDDFLIRVVSLFALFALGYLDFALYLSVLGVWVLLVEYSVWIFGTRALLGSTVDTCSTGGLGRISEISTFR